MQLAATFLGGFRARLPSISRSNLRTFVLNIPHDAAWVRPDLQIHQMESSGFHGWDLSSQSKREGTVRQRWVSTIAAVDGAGGCGIYLSFRRSQQFLIVAPSDPGPDKIQYAIVPRFDTLSKVFYLFNIVKGVL